jgi:hypothetical protein
VRAQAVKGELDVDGGRSGVVGQQQSAEIVGALHGDVGGFGRLQRAPQASTSIVDVALAAGARTKKTRNH